MGGGIDAVRESACSGGELENVPGVELCASSGGWLVTVSEGVESRSSSVAIPPMEIASSAARTIPLEFMLSLFWSDIVVERSTAPSGSVRTPKARPARDWWKKCVIG
tara:strand:- start:846 stop:1166 length:321 start_codon:yes stop_codon:yes gene_type:complete